MPLGLVLHLALAFISTEVSNNQDNSKRSSNETKNAKIKRLPKLALNLSGLCLTWLSTFGPLVLLGLGLVSETKNAKIKRPF